MLAIVTKRPHSLDTEIRLEQSNNSCEGNALGDGEGSRDLYPILSTGFFLHVGADMQVRHETSSEAVVPHGELLQRGQGRQPGGLALGTSLKIS